MAVKVPAQVVIFSKYILASVLVNTFAILTIEQCF